MEIKRQKKVKPVEKEIERIDKELNNEEVGSDRYLELLDIRDRLLKQRKIEKDISTTNKVKSDTIANGVIVIGQTAIVAFRDYWHPIATKAFSLIAKPRI